MKHLIIGNGEIGTSLKNIFNCEALGKHSEKHSDVDIIHITFPYSDEFIEEVKRYQNLYNPKYTIIHSTVPVGTSRKCNAIHSPVVGIHPYLEESIRTFIKFLGGEQAGEVADSFRRANLKVFITDKQETTELMKLLCTTKYGMDIEYVKDVKRQCDKNKVPFEAWVLWTKNYNKGYGKLGQHQFVRPNLIPIMTGQGGHCTQSNAVILHETTDSNFAKFLLSGGYRIDDDKRINDKTWLYCEYIGKEKSSLEIGKEIGYSDVWVVKQLKKFGIPIRDRGWAKSEIKKILSLVELGNNLKDISKLFPKRTYDAIRNVAYKKLKVKSPYKPGEETKKLEIRKKISSKLQGVKVDDWKGFSQTENDLLRKSVKYQNWRKAVFEKDNYTCVFCKVRSGNGKKVVLNADHIKKWSKYPKLRFELSNGRTLCYNCHKKVHKNK